MYSVFHQFRQATFAYGGSILSSNIFATASAASKNGARFKSGQRSSRYLRSKSAKLTVDTVCFTDMNQGREMIIFLVNIDQFYSEHRFLEVPGTVAKIVSNLKLNHHKQI